MADDPTPAPAGQRAGTGYFVEPTGGPGPGLLVLSSWWGLTGDVHAVCHRFADLGFSTLAPDLLAGALPETSAEAEVVLAESDVDATAGLVLSSAQALRGYSVDPRRPIGVVGLSMGGSWALWLSARLPHSISHVVTFYGSQNMDFSDARARYQGHWADHDDLVTADEVVELHARLRLAGLEVDFHRYPGTSHWFAEESGAGTHDDVAAALAWERTEAFLGDLLLPAS